VLSLPHNIHPCPLGEAEEHTHNPPPFTQFHSSSQPLYAQFRPHHQLQVSLVPSCCCHLGKNAHIDICPHQADCLHLGSFSVYFMPPLHFHCPPHPHKASIAWHSPTGTPHAQKWLLKKLSPLQNSCLRAISPAYKATPIQNL
jgi:hypothetical protein